MGLGEFIMQRRVIPAVVVMVGFFLWASLDDMASMIPYNVSGTVRKAYNQMHPRSMGPSHGFVRALQSGDAGQLTPYLPLGSEASTAAEARRVLDSFGPSARAYPLGASEFYKEGTHFVIRFYDVSGGHTYSQNPAVGHFYCDFDETTGRWVLTGRYCYN